MNQYVAYEFVVCVTTNNAALPSRLKSAIILVLDRLQCVARVNCLVMIIMIVMLEIMMMVYFTTKTCVYYETGQHDLRHAIMYHGLLVITT